MAKADPIFAAIEVQRRAKAEVDQIEILMGSDDYAEALDLRFDDAMESESAATEIVCLTPPTSAAGARALSRFIRERLIGQASPGELPADLMLQAVSSLESFICACCV